MLRLIQLHFLGGAFGSVYKGVCWGGTTTVALKKLHSAEQVVEFERETAMLKYAS